MCGGKQATGCAHTLILQASSPLKPWAAWLLVCNCVAMRPSRIQRAHTRLPLRNTRYPTIMRPTLRLVPKPTYTGGVSTAHTQTNA